MKSFFPTSQLWQLHAHFQFLTLCQTHPQNVGDGDVRGASNHDLEHSKKCMKRKAIKLPEWEVRKRYTESSVFSVLFFFRSFGSFCQCFKTNPQCLDRLPAHWLPVLPSTGFVANLERSKKVIVDPKPEIQLLSIYTIIKVPIADGPWSHITIQHSLMSGSRPHQNCTSGSWCDGCLCRSAVPPGIHLERGTNLWQIQRKCHKFHDFPFSKVTNRGSTRSWVQSSQTFHKQKPSQIANRKSNRKMTKMDDELCWSAAFRSWDFAFCLCVCVSCVFQCL